MENSEVHEKTRTPVFTSVPKSGAQEGEADMSSVCRDSLDSEAQAVQR